MSGRRAVLVEPFFRLNNLRYLPGAAGDAVGDPVKLDECYAKLLSDFATGDRAAARLNHPGNAFTEAGELPCAPGSAVEGCSFHFHCSPNVKPISASDSSIFSMNSGTISLKSVMY